MQLRVSLDKYLKHHGVSAYKLVQETEGRVARGSVYALARGEQVKRVDLETLGEVLSALERITGARVGVAELLEEVQPVEVLGGQGEDEEAFDPKRFLDGAQRGKPRVIGLPSGQRVPEGEWSVEAQFEEMRGRDL